MNNKIYSLLPGLIAGLCFTFGFIYYIYAITDLHLSEFNAIASSLLLSLLSFLLYECSQWVTTKAVNCYVRHRPNSHAQQQIEEASAEPVPQQPTVVVPQDDEQKRIDKMNAQYELHQRKVACALNHIEEYLIGNMNKEVYDILVEHVKIFVDGDCTEIPTVETSLKVSNLKQGDIKHIFYNIAFIFGINNLDTAKFIKNHFSSMFPESEPESIKKKLTSKSDNDVVPICKDLFKE